MDKPGVVNNFFTLIGVFRRAPRWSLSVTDVDQSEPGSVKIIQRGEERPQADKGPRTCDDPRRGGERGSSPRPTRGGEEPDRVSTVANDP